LKTDNHSLASLIDRFGLPVVTLLLLLGHFAPWAAHKTAALTFSAHELAVLTHTTPGAGIFLNQWFYLPIWVVALLGALLAGRIGWWLNRTIAGLVCVGLASLGLPGYPEVLTAYKVPDFQLQFYISLLVMLAVALLTLLRLGQRPALRRWLVLTLPLVSAVPLVGYLMVKPAIETLYNDTVGIGLGWWLTLAGVLLTLGMLAIMLAGRRKQSVSPASAR
jgi:hypothetical protein